MSDPIEFVVVRLPDATPGSMGRRKQKIRRARRRALTVTGKNREAIVWLRAR